MIRAVRNLFRSLARLGIFFVFLAASALAEEGNPSPADSSVGQVFRWINFILAVGIVLYLFRKAPDYFRAHAEEISQKIAEGARAREAAEKLRSEAQAKLANVGADVEEMRVEAKRAAALESERVRGLARTEAETIERAAQAEIAATERAARLELKTLAARKAMERAETILQAELTPKVEAERFRAFVSELEGSAN
jgi:F-type H+-transporting ATPase subunit b